MPRSAARPRSPYPGHYPLFVRLGRVVVFGGGRVGARKAASLARVARVTVVSREFTPALNRRRDIARVRADLDPRQPAVGRFLRGADLAVVATDDPALNRAIGARCRERRIWVNRADGVGDVVFPSVVRRDGFAVALVSGSPADTRRARRALQRALGNRGR